MKGKVIEELKNGVKVMNIEARYLYAENKKDSVMGYSTTDKTDLYTVRMAYSLGLEKMYEYWAEEFQTDTLGEKYTDMIINVSFKGAAKMLSEDKLNKDGTKRKATAKYIIKTYGSGKNQKAELKKVPKLKIEMNTSRLRSYLYEHGFVLNGNKYICFMRSASKSRSGDILFIKEQYVAKLLYDWARVGILFPEDKELDVAGIKSYESLVLSGICGKLKIKPEEILLIRDYESVFSSMASVTKLDQNNRLMVQNEETEYRNSIWDGMSLMDASKYDEFIEFTDTDKAHTLREKSFVLLRNLWFKSAAFYFDIQKFFKEHEVTIADVKKHGWTIAERVADIKLITTPNSLKILKIKDLIENQYPDEAEGQTKSMFEYWLNYIEENNYFGIVKAEHEARDHTRNCNSQFLMALPLAAHEIEELLNTYEFPYIKAMRNDDTVFLKHLGNQQSISNQMIYELGRRVAEFNRTELFLKFKNDTLNDYKESWKREGIKIPASDFCVCVSNPYEMMQYAAGKEPEAWERIYKGREAYCSYYQDGQKLFAARNPCVSSGNIICLTNKKDDMLSDYMRLSNNIVVVNSIDSDIMERASSMDYDSDQMYLSSNEILVEKAEYCEKHFLTPVNQVEKLKAHKHYTANDLAQTDNQIAKGKIGDIVNTGQILQAYYWHVFFSNNIADDLKSQILQRLYSKISMLSSASGVEIDRAKREFLMDTDKELKDLRQIGLLENEDQILFPYIEYDILKNLRKKTITAKELREHPNIIEIYEKIESYQLKKDLLSPLEKDDLRNLQKEMSDFLMKEHKEDEAAASLKMRKPLYFKYMFPNSQENSIYFEGGMNCPMDQLCILIDKRTPKKTKRETKVENITVLMKKYQKRANPNHIQSVKAIAKEYARFCASRRYQKQNGISSDGVTKKERFNIHVKQIQEINLTHETIRAIFNACYGSEAAKSHNEDVSKYRKHLIDLIYAAYPKRVIECFILQENA